MARYAPRGGGWEGLGLKDQVRRHPVVGQDHLALCFVVHSHRRRVLPETVGDYLATQRIDVLKKKTPSLRVGIANIASGVP